MADINRKLVEVPANAGITRNWPKAPPNRASFGQTWLTSTCNSVLDRSRIQIPLVISLAFLGHGYGFDRGASAPRLEARECEVRQTSDQRVTNHLKVPGGMRTCKTRATTTNAQLRHQMTMAPGAADTAVPRIGQLGRRLSFLYFPLP